MLEIILDIGSGHSLPDWNAAKHVIDSVLRVRDKTCIPYILKTQLFRNIPPNVPLKPSLFDEMAAYCERNQLRFTASVFDKKSLDILLFWPVPFVKIAYRPEMWPLGELIPRGIPVYISGSVENVPSAYNCKRLYCVAKYPAHVSDYCDYSPNCWDGISDHTVGLKLYNQYRPGIWEKHYAIEHSPSNPDAGPFSITPEDLYDVKAYYS